MAKTKIVRSKVGPNRQIISCRNTVPEYRVYREVRNMLTIYGGDYKKKG